MPVGWFSGVAVGLNSWLGVVGEVGGDYESVQVLNPPSVPALPTLHRRIYSFMAGPRFTVLAQRRVNLFGDLLVGETHRETSMTVGTQINSSVNYFAWQPAAGVDLTLAKRARLRAEGGVRITPLKNAIPDGAQFQPRVSVGLVFGRWSRIE